MRSAGSPKTFVQTEAASSSKMFSNQELRWASTNGGTNGKRPFRSVAGAGSRDSYHTRLNRSRSWKVSIRNSIKSFGLPIRMVTRTKSSASTTRSSGRRYSFNARNGSRSQERWRFPFRSSLWVKRLLS